MPSNAEILAEMRCIFKLYEKEGLLLREKYDLTQQEMDVATFLANNPALDTATDIVEYRMLPKANVSQAVEQLIRRGYLTRTPDTHDRRRVHLALTAAAAPLVEDVCRSRVQVAEKLFADFTPEERASLDDMLRRIAQNARTALQP